jgi:hypothetical protein
MTEEEHAKLTNMLNIWVDTLPESTPPYSIARQTLAHLHELAASPETRGEVRALIMNLFPELFGEL